MKKNRLYSLLLATVVLNVGCSGSTEQQQVIAEKINTDIPAADSSAKATDEHNAANSLDWPGTYKGVLPCADCEGITTQIDLRPNMTYTIKTTYLGKDDKAIRHEGSFAWNAKGNTIILSGIENSPNQYFVGENALIQLDMQGNKITGALADKYILAKQMAAPAAANQPDATLVETYWKLTELMGKPVAKTKDGAKETHILLKKNNNSISGFTGCNSIMGSYELEDGNYLRFTKLAGTLMACDDMKLEDDFKKVLGQTDNYSISGDYLSLNKAKMAPLAKFKAVYFK
jgi:copper homeostasis protein (lipoprotein)